MHTVLKRTTMAITVLAVTGLTTGSTLHGAIKLYSVSAFFRCAYDGSACGVTDTSGTVVVQDRLLSDVGSPYTGRTDVQEGAYISGGDFYFILQPLTVNAWSIWIDLSQRVGQATCGTSCTIDANFPVAGFATDNATPASLTVPVDASGNVLSGGFQGIPPGTSSNARFMQNFMDPEGRPIRYTIRMNSLSYSQSVYASVTHVCGGTGSLSCSVLNLPGHDEWTIEPAYPYVAALESQSTKTGQAPKILEGYFTMPFKITVVQ